MSSQKFVPIRKEDFHRNITDNVFMINTCTEIIYDITMAMFNHFRLVTPLLSVSFTYPCSGLASLTFMGEEMKHNKGFMPCALFSSHGI